MALSTTLQQMHIAHQKIPLEQFLKVLFCTIWSNLSNLSQLTSMSVNQKPKIAVAV